MSKIVTQHDEIIKFAAKFTAANGTNSYVPAYADKATNKKPACKGFIDYEPENAIKHDGLNRFPTMNCLGVRLGDDYIVLDMDGKDAIALLEQLQGQLGILPRTFHNGSLRGDREALWFKQPERWRGKFSYTNLSPKDQDKFEIRSGKCHQVAYGAHPLRETYKIFSTDITIAELPEKWCLYIAAKIAKDALEDGTIAQKTNGNGKKHYNNEGKLELALSMLRFLKEVGDPLGTDFTYNNRFKVGCALHSIDPSDDGLAAWFTWVCDAADGEYKTIQDLEPHWKSIKDGKKGGVTFGSIKGAFNAAYAAAKRNPEHSGIVDEFKPLIASVSEIKWGISDRAEFIRSMGSLKLSSAELSIECELYLKDAYGRVDRFQLDALIGDIVDGANTGTAIRVRQQAQFPIKEIKEYFSDDVTFEGLFNYSEKLGMSFPKFFMFWLVITNSLLPKGYQVWFNNSPRKPNAMIIIIGQATSGKSFYFRILINYFAKMMTKSKNQERKLKAAFEHTNGDAKKDLNKILEKTTEMDQNGKKLVLIDAIIKMKSPTVSSAPNSEFDAIEVPETTSGDGDEGDREKYMAMSYPEVYAAVLEMKTGTQRRTHQYATKQFTEAAIRRLSGECKERGILICPDEIMSLKGYVSNQSSAGGGDSSDNLFIQFLEGEETASDKVSEIQDADFYQGTIATSIQTIKVAQNFDVDNDANGLLSRGTFIFNEHNINVKVAETVESISGYEDLLTQLESHYLSFQAKHPILPPNEEGDPQKIEYRITDEAQKIWGDYRYRVVCSKRNDDDPDEDISIAARYQNHPKQGFYQWLRRSLEKITTYALFLHCMRQDGGTNRVISAETMSIAVKIVEWLEIEARQFYGIATETVVEGVEPEKQAAFDVVLKILAKKKTMTFRKDDSWMKRSRNSVLFTAYKLTTASLGQSGFITLMTDMHDLGLLKFDKDTMTATEI